MIPDWQLPTGTDRGLWDYVSSRRVADEYDAALSGTHLLEVDLAFADQHFPTPGKVIDLGCGTGRLLMRLAPRGFDCLGVDLSEPMLDVLRRKAADANLPIATLKANLVELDEVPAASHDYAACLFSTLGMLRGRENRAAFLKHVRRILKPGGVFVVHAHNVRFKMGFGLGRRGAEPGDRTMPQHRGGADLTLHHYTKRELLAELAPAGFSLRELRPVSTRPDGRLLMPWLFPGVRAYGYLVAAVAG
ncbi:class I SAM-dependent methyltransferase [Zavarzinella formosa]|uniref:class I SAM-dependent methyltransferase n=1 Tax=Zavarzinella formosa TaxID=360055 RepID=UPI0002D6C920|nr:class I SAM-dependent methyltransferase [Zavarzinella formosa]